MRYRVYVPEVHYLVVEVEADDEGEAFEKAQDTIAKSASLELEYSHTIDDMGQWQIERVYNG
ncbi:MAG: hypothetical protein L0Y56_06185 [Nitrospira sp.]|nr:hypothetical protein [Nitrospira sp.]